MGGDPTKRFINRRTNAKSIPGVSSHRVYHRYVGFLCCFAIEAWPVKPAWETTHLSSRRRGNKRLFIGRRVSRLDRGRSIESLPFVSFNEPHPRLDIPREPDPEVMNFISRCFIPAYASSIQRTDVAETNTDSSFSLCQRYYDRSIYRGVDSLLYFIWMELIHGVRLDLIGVWWFGWQVFVNCKHLIISFPSIYRCLRKVLYKF